MSRLIRHTTTIDPYLDESGASPRRLGPLTLDGVTCEALDLSPAVAFRIELRAAGRAVLRVPCGVLPQAAGDVRFEVVASAPGAPDRRREIAITPQARSRWHVVALRVPRGPLTLTLRASAAAGAPAAGAICGVPSLTWRKSSRAVSRSLAFAMRTLGVSGTVRHVRGRIETGNPAAQYADWLACHALTAEALAAARTGATLLPVRPRFLILLEDAASPAAAATTASLESQVYDGWELRPAADAAARNAALDQSAADFVAVVRAGDRLSPLALLRAAERIAARPDVDVIYTDEDVWPLEGERTRPRLKPDWSPELLESCMYLGRLVALRRDAVRAAGGYRAAAGAALDYDVALRVSQAGRVEHVPELLYHRGAAGPDHADSVSDASAAVLEEACRRQGLAATVVAGAVPGVWRACVGVAERPRVAIVIPTDGQGPARGAPAFVAQCVASLRQRTRYPNYDLLVCDNGNLRADTRAFLDTVPHRRVTYTWEGAFNFPRKINFAVRQTDAPFVLLLNDDVEPINEGWLDAMLEYAHRPQIGAVGAKLFYPDGRLQHVGVAVGVCGVAAHLLHQHPGGTQGCDGIAIAPRNCSAVTGACLLTRRHVYDEVGGFDEALALDFNDVDFCLGVRRAGYRIVFTPHARLFHHESASFGARRQRAEEVATMWRKWGAVLEHDPYYNLNLSRDFPDCRLASCR